MPDNNAEGRQDGALNPQALRLADMARVLSASGPSPVTVEMLQADIDDGAPTNADGTMNLVHYAAWLVKEMAGARLTRDNSDRPNWCGCSNSTPLGEVIGERQLLAPPFPRWVSHRRRPARRSVPLRRPGWWRYATSRGPKPNGDPYETLKDRARAATRRCPLPGATSANCRP